MQSPRHSPIRVAIIDEPIDVERLQRFVSGDTQCGGINCFYGVVRQEHDALHGELVRLDYYAYAEMTCQQIRRIGEEAMQRWSARRVAMVHRVGPVSVGELAVAIAVACSHREQSFQACRFLIDAIKSDVPIWKQDVFEDGTIKWVEPPQEQNANHA